MPPTAHRHAPGRRTSYLASFIRWLQLKNYQYEATFSLYMLTPTEKIIFNFILLILISMLVAAATMYLPNHVVLIYNRIWYYIHGEFANITGNGAGTEVLKSAGSDVVVSSQLVAETAESVLRRLREL